MSTDTPLEAAVQARSEATVAQLKAAVRDYGQVVYSSSLGVESIVLTDLIWTQVPQIGIFTLDTGRLHEETLSLIERLERRYGKRMKVYYPDPQSIEAWVAGHGINGFYNSVEERRGCCHIRKVEPFRRAIAGAGAWVTGVRREQSSIRALAQPMEIDDANGGIARISPILDWTHEEVWHYIRSRRLPYNPLHDKGFPSIGCAPCTRAVEPGEDSRAGRWWWENTDAKECGLQPRIRTQPAA
ncbi:MAG TPA: phosphoadenylyl-sulfate reductase [Steroidobacteraceae bacterium]|nr:phosphoadenylyl-sulfate reductase [Steroidobacteraceae bacterium]